MTKRTTWATKAAPAHAPKVSGKNIQPQRLLRAPKAFFDLIDRAIGHNANSDNTGGYAGFSDWSRHHLAIAAADELGIDPLDALRSFKSD